MINKYEDIINLPHPESKKHSRMSIEARAAQFAPFSALTGYDDEIKETARLTQKKIELNNDQKLNISNKITICQKEKKEAIFTYFVFDKRKDGGNMMKTLVNEILKEKSFCENITDELKLHEDLGLDSLNMVELMVELEERFNL